MDRHQQIIDLLNKYYDKAVKSKADADVGLKVMSESDEEEVGFSALCYCIKTDGIEMSDEDKKLIDEIGEGLWNTYGESRMETKYWKDLV